MLWRDIWQAFAKSWGRFVSIVCLVSLGSFALVGLSVTGPDMRDTGNTFFAQHHLSDISVIGDYGLSREDRTDINRAPGASRIEYGYLKDVVIKDTDTSVRIFSAPEHLSTYDVIHGRMPRTVGEIAVDSAHESEYPIGSTYEITEKADQMGDTVLRRTSFTVVGVVHSTEILSNVNMGQSQSGSGSLEGYGVVTPEAFDSDTYMIARLSYSDLERMGDHYSDAYADRLQQHKDDLDRILAGRPADRLKEIKNQLTPQIDEGRNKLDDAKTQLTSTQRQLDDAKTQLDTADKQIAAGEQQLSQSTADAEASIAQGKADVASAQVTYNAKHNEYQNAAAQVAAAREQMNTAQAQVSQAQTIIDSLTTAAKSLRDEAIQTANDNDELSDEARKAAIDAANAAYGQTIKVSIEPQQRQLDSKKAQVNAAQAQVNARERELAEAKSQLDDAQTQLDEGNAKVAQGEADLASQQASAQASIDAAKAKLAAKQQEYNTKKAEFDKRKPQAERQISDSQAALDEQTAKLNALEEPVYALDSRRETPGSEGYRVYDNISIIVDSLARVFPYFMYFVAALVTFTTMTRFVDEERINAGTLKALGYSDRDVMRKFLIYGFTASCLGAIIGIAAGHLLMPLIVYNAYKVGFNIPFIHLGFHWPVTVLALVLAFLSAVFPAWVAAFRELRERPASLLLPKPPSAGSKILLERIPAIWGRLSFTHKVTARNIFRYKQRMFMTVFGVAGSVALLMAGLGVQGSISGVSENQFGNIITYDLIVSRNNHVTDSQQKQIDSRLGRSDVERSTSVRYQALSKVAGRNSDKQSITMIVPKDENDFAKYLSLRTRSGHEPLQLAASGAVISERFANLIGAKQGDVITVQDSVGESHRVKVTGIAEMYIGHFMFMSPSAYRQAFHTDYSPNAHLVTLRNDSLENTRTQAASFMRLGGVNGVVQNTNYENQIATVVRALNKIMQVLILIAALLAVVILYNLTNLNVAERIRELSTIKVLGFYEREVTMYIYRETLLLSVFGVLAGYGFGAWLHRYIITAVPPEEVMFDPTIVWQAFVVPFVLIALITAALGWYVNRKLRKVDMLEALKSVE